MSSKENQGFDTSHNAAAASATGGSMLGHLRAAAAATLILAVICCAAYPAAVWAIGHVVFPNQANGSLIRRDGSATSKPEEAIGSLLIGQSFSAPGYFHSRPSSAGNGYDAGASGGSNLGPLSTKWLDGTVKNYAYTVFAADKADAAVVPVAGRVQGTVLDVTKTTITLTPAGAAPGPTTQGAATSGATTQGAATPGATTQGAGTQYALDPTVADPNAAVSYHGRSVHPTTIPRGAIVELKLNDKTPPAVIAVSVVDQEIDAPVVSIDTSTNKITLGDSGSTVLVFDPKASAFIVNGKTDAKFDALLPGMSIHAIVSLQMDFDGVADRVIHYCQDNSIKYTSSIPDSAFMDADGIDDQRLVAAFSAAASAAGTASGPAPTIVPESGKAVPADAVTGSGSGLDPHISPRNAELQAGRVAAARNVSVDKVMTVVAASTDHPQFGVLGDPGVNVLKLNLALDAKHPIPAPPTTAPTTGPTTGPTIAAVTR